MTTEELIENFINAGVDAYKKNYRNSKQGRMLDRHEPVEICGETFRTWRKLAVYSMAEHIQEIMPNADVSVVMDGNNSTLSVSVDEEEQRELNRKLFVFLKKWRCL